MQTVNAIPPAGSTDRTAVLLQESRVRIYEKTDRLFARLLLLQWLAGIAVALFISPQTWIGQSSSAHLHLWAAIFLGGAIAGLPLYLAWKQPGQVLNRHVIAVAQMLSSGLLIHLTGGRIETHFHTFGSLAFLAFYRDWRVLLTATIVTTADHMLRGWFWPQSVFGLFTAANWRWIEHASWVAFEDIFLFISIRVSNREMEKVARFSQLETSAQRLTEDVAEARRCELELRTANEALAGEVVERKRAEAATGELQAQHELILNSISEGIHWIDQDSRIAFENPAAARMLGYQPGELIGRRAHATLHHHHEDGTDYPRAESPIYAGLRDGQPRSRINEVFWRKDGTSFPVEYTSSPTRGAKTEIAGTVVVFSDISEREQAVKALAELSERTARRERLLTTMLSFISDFTYIFDRDGRFLFVNQPLLDLWGITLDEAIGRTFLDLKYPEELAEKLARQIREVFETGQPVTDETVYTSPAGLPGVYEYIFTPALAEEGTVGFVVGCTRDITARKTAETALLESERRQREVARELEIERGRLLDAQAAGKIGSWEVDRRTGKVNWSEETHRIFETDKSRFDGTFGAILAVVHPEDRAGVETAFASSRAQLGSNSIEHRLLLADGRITFVEERWQHLYDDAGLLSRTVGTVQDVSEQKRAEAALRESDEWLRAIFEASRDGLIVEDRGTIRYANTAYARILGYETAAELIGRPLADFLPADEAERLGAYGAARTRGEKPPAFYEFKGRRKDGSLVHVEAAVAVCLVGGRQYITTAIRDITDRRLDEAEREKINGLLLDTSRQAGMAEVATSVLHNVGNVLNSVNVSCAVISESVRNSRVITVARTAELLQEHASDLPAFFTSDPVGRTLPEFIGKLAQRLGEEQALVLAETEALSQNIEHIREIVSVQQDYAKNIGGVRETLTIGGLVEDAVRMNSAALIRHRVELIREFAETPALQLEKHKVLQILVNLIRNAKHALVASEQPNRQLTIRIGTSNGHVAVSVSDNGAGIAPENLTRVFTHGFTTKKSGHGFGLHNGVLAAQQMGGRLSVHSEGVGCGATFTLELPLILEGAMP